MCVQCDVRVVGGIYLNNVVIVVCFVASVMLSLSVLLVLCCPFQLMFLFVHSYCKARRADFC